MGYLKNNILKAYLARAKEIIGKRTPAEVAYDDAVVAGLEMGLPIEAALANAGKKHPSEALSWDADTLDDVAAHYDYLKEHARIMRKMQGQQLG